MNEIAQILNLPTPNIYYYISQKNKIKKLQKEIDTQKQTVGEESFDIIKNLGLIAYLILVGEKPLEIGKQTDSSQFMYAVFSRTDALRKAQDDFFNDAPISARTFYRCFFYLKKLNLSIIPGTPIKMPTIDLSNY